MPRTADEVMWSMQSYFPDGEVTARPYAGDTDDHRRAAADLLAQEGRQVRGARDLRRRVPGGFDRKITDWACDFMTRSTTRQAVLRLPALHAGPHPADPRPRVRRQDQARELGRHPHPDGRLHRHDPRQARRARHRGRHDRGVGLRQRRRPDYRFPAIDPDPPGGQWHGFSGPWRGGLFTSLEGSNRTPCIIRWPGNVPAGKVSNELVHQVDFFNTLVKAAAAPCPTDRQIDGMDMADFLLGDAEESGRDTVLVHPGRPAPGGQVAPVEGPPVQAGRLLLDVERRTTCRSSTTWSGTPARNTQVDFPHGWVIHPMAAAAGTFLLSLAKEPPIKPGTPDPYTPPPPGEWQAQTHLQIGPIIQFVTSLVQTHDEVQQPDHGIEHQSG